jgi:NADPH:quinone reductase-like Zn-dependent oxidoreductase
MVVQLGKRYGFRTINVVRRPELVAELKELGADEVLTAEGDALVEASSAITQGKGVRFVLDPVGGDVGSAAFRCLGNGGRMLVYGSLADQPIRFSPRAMLTTGATVEPFWLGRYMQSLGLLKKVALIQRVSKLVSAGVLAAPIGDTFPLERIADAVRAAETPGKAGKVLVRIAE